MNLRSGSCRQPGFAVRLPKRGRDTKMRRGPRPGG